MKYSLVCISRRMKEPQVSLTYGKTTAEAAFNTYTEEQLVDYVLAGLCHTRKDVY
jgi:hypothetical protein